MRRRLLVGFGAVAVLTVVALVWPQLPTVATAAAWLEGLRGGGADSTAWFIAAYAAATLLMVPASWIQATAGFLYGPMWGFVFAWAASTLFGTVAFVLARTALRRPLSHWLERSRRLDAVDRAVGDGGTGLVVLLRLSPISPYNVVNYLLGLTRVRFGEYLLGTWLGSVVPVLLYSVVGASVGDLTAVLAGEAAGPSWVRWVGLATTVMVTLGVTAFAKRTLNRAMADATAA